MINRFRIFWSKLDQGGLRIAALYMLVGGGWILFSDNLAAIGTQTDRISVSVSIYKGWGFMLVTGIMLYLLIQKDNHSLRAVNKNYLLLAENISDVIWVLDLNTSSFTYISPSIQQLRGLTFKDDGRNHAGFSLACQLGIFDEYFANPHRRVPTGDDQELHRPIGTMPQGWLDDLGGGDQPLCCKL